MTSLTGAPLKYVIVLNFKVNNNKAENEALIANLRLVKVLGIKSLRVKSDSHLVINCVNGKYATKGGEVDINKMREHRTRYNQGNLKLTEDILMEANKLADSLNNPAFGGVFPWEV